VNIFDSFCFFLFFLALLGNSLVVGLSISVRLFNKQAIFKFQIKFGIFEKVFHINKSKIRRVLETTFFLQNSIQCNV